MAASSLNVVRVRLHFDYPPPAISTCRMCWLLIDLNKCRVVADLVSVIRKKFDYSRKTCLDLFIEDCYLPPSESIYVVRDNDSIRVKAEGLSIKNGTESDAPKSSRVKKRRRETLEQEVPDEQTNIRALKKKKQAEESPATQQNVTQDVKKKKKSKKRKRNEEHASERQTDSAKHNPVASVTKPQLEKSSKRQQPSASALNGKPVDGKPKETSSDSSDSSEEEPSKRLAQHPKPQKKGSSSVGPVSKPGNAAKRRDNSSSSDSDSDTDSTLFQPPPKKPTPAKSLPAKSKPSPQKAAVSSKPKQPPSKQQAQSSSSDSDSDSSSSAEMPPPKRIPPVPSSNPKTSPSTISAAAGGFKKPTAKTVETSSDTDDSSSSSERPPVKKPSAPCPQKAPVSVPCTPKTPSAPSSAAPAAKPAVGTSAKPAPSTSESDISEEEIELVIRKPVLNGMGLSVAGVVSSSPIVGAGRGRAEGKSPGRGIGRGDGRFARRGSIGRERGRGGGRGNGTPWNKGFRYDYSDEDQNKKRWLNDSLTNTSLILQNPPEPAPPRDYSGFPLLAAPPAVGQKIAFKLLELTANYSPEVSDYKEGKITGLNVTTNMVELELLSAPKVPVEPGRFDLVYENLDGSEVVEYAVTQGSQLTERWDTLLEPRLIVDNVG